MVSRYMTSTLPRWHCHCHWHCQWQCHRGSVMYRLTRRVTQAIVESLLHTAVARLRQVAHKALVLPQRRDSARRPTRCWLATNTFNFPWATAARSPTARTTQARGPWSSQSQMRVRSAENTSPRVRTTGLGRRRCRQVPWRCAAKPASCSCELQIIITHTTITPHRFTGYSSTTLINMLSPRTCVRAADDRCRCRYLLQERAEREATAPDGVLVSVSLPVVSPQYALRLARGPTVTHVARPSS